MRAVWLILILSSSGCVAQAPAVCPWLSTGSAAEALGGPVETDLNIENSSQGTCRFTHESGNEQESIEINIGKLDTHPCPADSAKIVGLGNEALECRMTKADGPVLELIAGRVRNIYFVVAIKNPHAKSTANPEAAYRGDPAKVHILELVAEQVVGNLY